MLFGIVYVFLLFTLLAQLPNTYTYKLERKS